MIAGRESGPAGPSRLPSLSSCRAAPITVQKTLPHIFKMTCYSKELRHSEQALDEAYKTIVDRLENRPDSAMALELAEEAWKVYRDAECLFSASGGVGGSVYPMLLSECKDELTRARLARLNAYLHCKEGDLACPEPSAR